MYFTQALFLGLFLFGFIARTQGKKNTKQSMVLAIQKFNKKKNFFFYNNDREHTAKISKKQSEISLQNACYSCSTSVLVSCHHFRV